MTNSQQSLTTAQIKSIMRMSKVELARIITRDAKARGSEFIIGGPGEWSHDELVNYWCREMTAELNNGEYPR